MTNTQEITKGSSVQYYDAWYEYTSELNEYGDREVVDVHVQFDGIVLTQCRNEALVLNLEKLKCGWCQISKLTLQE